MYPPCNEGTDDETKHNEHPHQLAQVRRPSESYMLRAMRARVLFPEHNTNRHVCNVYRHPFATMGTSNLVHERPLGQGYDDWKSSVASKQRAVSTLSLPEHGPLGLVHSARQMSCESASTFMTIADATTAPLRTNTDDNAYRLHRLLVCVWSRHAGPQLQEHTSVLLIGTPGRSPGRAGVHWLENHGRGTGAPQGADKSGEPQPREHPGHRRGRRRTKAGVAQLQD